MSLATGTIVLSLNKCTFPLPRRAALVARHGMTSKVVRVERASALDQIPLFAVSLMSRRVKSNMKYIC